MQPIFLSAGNVGGSGITGFPAKTITVGEGGRLSIMAYFIQFITVIYKTVGCIYVLLLKKIET